MSRLSDLYKAMETLRKEGLSLNEDLEKQVSDLEENIIKKEILPIVTETIAPALKQVQRELVLVVDYVPGSPISVHRFPPWSSSPSLAGAPCAWQMPARFWARCPRPFSPSSPAASRRATWWSSLAWCARRWTRATTLWSLRATWWGTCATFTPPLSRVPSPSCWTARPRRRRRLRRRLLSLRTPTAWRAS